MAQKWFIKFLNSATKVKSLHLNNKSELDREDKFGLYTPWGFWSTRWPRRWFAGRESEPLRSLLGWPAPHSVLRGTPRQNEPGMNRGAQTWDCGELGREGKRKEELKDGMKGRTMHSIQAQTQSQRDWEEWKMFLYTKLCLYTEFDTRPRSAQIHTASTLLSISTSLWSY